MAEAGKFAQENIETVHHQGDHGIVTPRAKAAAIIIAIMAATLAIADLNVHHAMKTVISAENAYGNDRTTLDAIDNHRVVLENQNTVLEVLSLRMPNLADQVSRKEAANRAEMKRLAAQEEAKRKSIAHHVEEGQAADDEYSVLEIAVGILQIGIVLASVSIVAGALWLLLGGAAAGAIGLALVVYGLYLL